MQVGHKCLLIFGIVRRCVSLRGERERTSSSRKNFRAARSASPTWACSASTSSLPSSTLPKPASWLSEEPSRSAPSLYLFLHAASKNYREMSVLLSTGYRGRVHSCCELHCCALLTRPSRTQRLVNIPHPSPGRGGGGGGGGGAVRCVLVQGNIRQVIGSIQTRG